MRNKLVLWLSAFAITCLVTTLDARQKNWGPFDRLSVTQGFLDAVYPDLKHAEGVLFLRAEEFHAATGAGNYVDLLQCKPGSGIVYPNSPGQALQPHCAGMFLPSPSDFLSLSVTYGSKYPIHDFGAKGSFVESRGKTVARQIVENSDWTNEQRIEAARKSDMRFGPDRKDQFLASIPVQAILEFTGCRLVLKSAEFNTARLEGEAGHDYALVEWRVIGERRGPGRPSNQRCVARFEPFDGKLVQLGEL